MPAFWEKILTMLWWGERGLNPRQCGAIVLNILVGQARKNVLCQGKLLTQANAHIHILKVNWHMLHLALQWFGTAKPHRGKNAALTLTGPSVRLWVMDWRQPAPLPPWALCFCKVLDLCVTNVPPLSLSVCVCVCVSQTATDWQSNQPTMVSGCTFTNTSDVLVLSLVDPRPVLMFITF